MKDSPQVWTGCTTLNFEQICPKHLTLFQVGLKIYVSWWGGAFKAPPMFSLKMTYLGPKNNKTIIPHIFEDLMEGLEPKHPPMAPQKPTFLRHIKNTDNWKFSKK